MNEAGPAARVEQHGQRALRLAAAPEPTERHHQRPGARLVVGQSNIEAVVEEQPDLAGLAAKLGRSGTPPFAAGDPDFAAASQLRPVQRRGLRSAAAQRGCEARGRGALGRMARAPGGGRDAGEEASREFGWLSCQTVGGQLHPSAIVGARLDGVERGAQSRILLRPLRGVTRDRGGDARPLGGVRGIGAQPGAGEARVVIRRVDNRTPSGAVQRAAQGFA